MRTLYASLLVFVLFFVGTLAHAFSYDGQLRITEVSDTSITLAWDMDENASNYIVYYDYTDTLDPDDPQYFEQSDPTSETMLEVDLLESDTYYSFVVVSLNELNEESDNYSNQVTVKTYKPKPVFELSTNEIIVSDPKTIVIPFTRIINSESDVDVRVTHVNSGAEVFVKGYLPGTDDLRKLQVFFSEELRQGDDYILEVLSIRDSAGEMIDANGLIARTFGADYEMEKIGDVDLQDSSSDAQDTAQDEITEPVPIDTLPNTGPSLLVFVVLACAGLAWLYFFRQRRRI